MLYPLQKKGRWGYINERLDWVVDPVFDAARPLSDDFAAVQQGGLSGFIDRQGRLACPPSFLKVGNFSEGLCWIRDRRGHAYVRTDFSTAFRLRCATAFRFQGGLAPFDASGRLVYSYARADGTVALRGNNTLAHCSEGLVAYRKTLFAKLGYKNQRGAWVIPPQFDRAETFSEGLAAVSFQRGRKTLTGFIGLDGEVRIPCVVGPEGPFAGKRAKFWRDTKRGPKLGYIDPGGQIVIEPQFDNGSAFSGELAPVEQRGKWGWIDRDGKWICRPKFEIVSDDLRRPFIWAQHRKTLGYFSREGSLIIKNDPG